MNDFLIFYAPILVTLASIVAAFWLASKDDPIKRVYINEEIRKKGDKII